MRSLSRPLFIAGLAVIAVASAASAKQSPTRRYSAPKYGVSVGLPAHANVCGPIAPNPNHGVLFRPAGVTSPPCDDDIESGDRYTDVDAHFAPDDEPAKVSAMARKECPEFAFDSQGRVSFPSPPPLPSGLHRAACRIDGADGTITVLLLVRRATSAGVPAIDYTLTLRTTRALYATDYPAFVRWLSSVRFTRPL